MKFQIFIDRSPMLVSYHQHCCRRHRSGTTLLLCTCGPWNEPLILCWDTGISSITYTDSEVLIIIP